MHPAGFGIFAEAAAECPESRPLAGLKAAFPLFGSAAFLQLEVSE